MSSSSLYESLVSIIEDRTREKEAESRRVYEATKAEFREKLLKKVAQIMSEVTPLVPYDVSKMTFDAAHDTWRLTVSGFEFSLFISHANITATLVPPICTKGCTETISTTNDLIMLVSRHMSFRDHSESRAAA